MAFFNYSTMHMTAKIVYYGPGLGGKTTNLQFIYGHTTDEARGEMVSLETHTDRTLFFDLLPMEVGTVAGFRTKIQLYTVPGQVFYNTTRKLVLKGVDGIVFVADSQAPMLDANRESMANLASNLLELGMSVEAMPLVIQYNKRDLHEVSSIDVLEREINPQGRPFFEASAITGQGVFETLREISRQTLRALKQELEATPQRGAPARGAAGATASAAAGATLPEEPAPANPDPPATAPDPFAPTSPAGETPAAPTLASLIPPPDGAGSTAADGHDAAPPAAGAASAAEPAAAPRRRQEVTRDLLVRVPSGDLRRTAQLAMGLRLEDASGRVLQETRSVRIDTERDEPPEEIVLKLRLMLVADP